MDFPELEPASARRRRSAGSARRPGSCRSRACFAWIRVEGREHLDELDGPVVFAANHQSHFDVPVILAALPGHVRKTVAPAMSKEFFKAHFFPEGQPWRQVFSKRLNYYLAAFFFNAFPLPQREAGARQTLRYIGEVTGDGFSVLIFPEGVRSETGEMTPFRGGIGMIALAAGSPGRPGPHRRRAPDPAREVAIPRPGRVTVRFGAPMRLKGDDYARARREQVRARPVRGALVRLAPDAPCATATCARTAPAQPEPDVA